jgi:hypothetical protein
MFLDAASKRASKQANGQVKEPTVRFCTCRAQQRGRRKTRIPPKNEERNKTKGNQGSIPASCRKQLSSEALNKKKPQHTSEKRVKKQGVPNKKHLN